MSVEPNSNWQVGDLAICLVAADGVWSNSVTNELVAGPQQDQVVRVIHVWADANFGDGRDTGLEFSEFPDDIYPACKFRRVVPDAESATDQHIIALIKGRGLRVSA